MNGKFIATKLLSITNGILGVEKNPEIQERLISFGYTSERMDEGKGLLNKVTRLKTIQVEERSDQFIATSEFDKRRTTTYSDYMIVLKVFRF
jgi:hypothetical protein